METQGSSLERLKQVLQAFQDVIDEAEEHGYDEISDVQFAELLSVTHLPALTPYRQTNQSEDLGVFTVEQLIYKDSGCETRLQNYEDDRLNWHIIKAESCAVRRVPFQELIEGLIEDVHENWSDEDNPAEWLRAWAQELRRCAEQLDSAANNADG